MDPRSYNHYHPNAQAAFSTSGHHSQGSEGSHRSHPLPPQAYGSLNGPPPGDGTGRFPSPAHGSSRSGHPLPDDGTRRHYPPGTIPAYSPQNTVPHQVVAPHHQDLSRSTPYNLYTTPQGPSLPAHGSSQSGPFLHDPPNPPPNPGPSRLKQSGHPPAVSGRGDTKQRLLSMVKYALVCLFRDYGVKNQPVHVRISANAWVVGVIVGIVNLTGLISGCKYRVEYESTNGTLNIREFCPENMAPI